MSYVNLGKSGLKVSKLILGVMTYGSGQDWMIPDHEEGIRQMKYAYDQGINTFDTANTYSAGESEIILGKFLKKHEIPRESVVILTKTFNPDDSDGGPAGLVNQKGLSRKRIFASVKRSLERLQLDYVDVLQCHRFDYDTPIEETMQALHDLVQQGLVHYIGMSSCWAWQMQLMQQYAINNRLTPFISMQNQHSAMYREEEREMMPMLKHFGVGVIPWGPMGGGLLCRPFQEMDSTTRASQLTSQPGDKLVINAIEKIANDRQVPMAAVALAWSLQSPWVTAPIVGVRSTERLDELIGALELKLTDEERKSIDDGYSPVKPRSFQ
ncbi:NADP-dependent oxidoreductase domain-containing protein [Dioszegia hungarica]|uniref:NADP-dependent oxidoreductase domain-containing protein n=1 Tax=Dioszegia hungarica TaxID=4972 RepID=A0AA38HBA5_9TREE|nr:NADP-dependent oxidoreductase domain-containing protein [Dioszegia hungarica]KAI9636439.1 NADP-dependent oxidoreductase domain-containing protein [Dioszegia hungarica]